MVIQNVTVNDCTPQTIVIGRRGTYDTMQIAFDLTNLVQTYGSGTAVLAVKRSQDASAYPAVTSQADNTLTWTITETDTYYVGSGECQLMWYVDGGLAKTIIYPMVVMRDILATSEEAPDAYQTWVDDLTAMGAETLQNAQDAAQSASDAESAKDDAVDAKEAAEDAAEKAEEASIHAPIIQGGYWYIWNNGQYVDTGVRAEGQKGDQGDPGEKGDTGNGIANIAKTGTSGLVDTYTVTYTNGTTTTFTVTNGAKGDKGDTGATGNGIQSITKTGTSGNVDTYTITYTNGQTTTFTVTNGAVSSVAGKTGAVTLDANDVAFSESGTYDDGTLGAEVSDQKNAISELNRHLSDVDDYVGMQYSVSRTINNTASYIGVNDSKILFNAESGDEININITGTAFTQTVYTAYVFYEDNPNTGVSVGNGTVGVDKTITLAKNIVGVGIYALNLTEGMIVIVCQNISEKGLTKRIADLELASSELGADVDNLTENLENTDGKVDSFITVVKSKNLYKGVPLAGYRSNLTVVESTTYGYTPPILLKPGSYLFTSTEAAMGSEGGKAFICDLNGNAQAYIVGTLVGNKTQAGVYNNRPILQFTLQEDSYVSFNIGAINGSTTAIYSGNFMLVNGSTIGDFPDYEAYFEPYAEMNDNVPLNSKMIEQVNGLSGLIGKTAIFDGDSICKGTINGTTPKETNGWAGYVGEANAMSWHNYGISGGVITSASNPAVTGHHSVVDTVDTMYAQYPDADYVIFEGGTNDADLIGNAIADPTILGTYTSMDFSGPFDATTFTGALETIFSKATSYWKGKSIGYIVAQKMGYSTTGFDKDHANRRAYFERAIEICNKWGVPYINLWDDCYLNPNNPACYDRTKTNDENISGGYLYTDGQHLTEKGYEYISPIIEAWMKTL